MNSELTGGILAGAALVLLPLFLLLALRKGPANRKRRENEELARTHEQIRRYTADLERTHAEKEKRLAEITLLHRFASAVHGQRQNESVYGIALDFVSQASEAPWIFLCHRRGGEGRLALRSHGDLPPAALEWARGHAASLEPEAGDLRIEPLDVPGLGACRAHRFVRPGEDGSRLCLLLLFPLAGGRLGEDQAQVVSVIANRVESELTLIALSEQVQAANRRLTEGNDQLRLLIELENQFSRAFLDRHEVSETFQTLHEIMAKRIFAVDRINLFLPNAETGMLEAATSIGIGDYPLAKVRVPVDERGGALSLSFREGRSILFDGHGPVPPEYRLAEPFASLPPIRSRIFLIVPIKDHEGRVLGIIAADRKYSHKPITPETAMMLEAFARHTALLFTLRRQASPCP